MFKYLNSQIFAIISFFLFSELWSLGFDIELDTFRDTAAIFGNLTFTNIIGRMNPNAEEFVTLACHYDSKWIAGGEMQAATDSAVPCAIMLNTIRTIKKSHPQLLSKDKADISVMVSAEKRKI